MAATPGLAQVIEQILDIARWAPSGDNAQPWQFQITSPNIVNVLIRYELGNVYEYRQGEPTLISAGALLENIVIAAQKFGKKATWKYLSMQGHVYCVEVNLEGQEAPQNHTLLGEIERRSVDRRPYKLKSLPVELKNQLSEALDLDCSVQWYESFAERYRVASLCKEATEIRLKIPETFEIHRRIVDWDKKFSADAIPAGALGVDTATLKLMRWSLAKRRRAEMANLFGSAFFAGIQMDILPGIFSAAYFSLHVRNRAEGPREKIEQMLRVGQAVQRFWLAATKTGLVLQPCLAMLAFAYYGRHAIRFTASRREQISARHLAEHAKRMFQDLETVVFLGRIGYPTAESTSRSVRLPLDRLMTASQEHQRLAEAKPAGRQENRFL